MDLEVILEALERAQRTAVDLETAIAVDRALSIVRRRMDTSIYVGKTPAGDWAAWLSDRPSIVNHGLSSGEAIGWLHSTYALAQPQHWPGLRVDVVLDTPKLPSIATGDS